VECVISPDVKTSLKLLHYLCNKPVKVHSSSTENLNPMQNTLLHLQFECDRAAREFLALAAWGFNRSAVRDAVNRMTSGSSQSTSALAWLIEHTSKLPLDQEPARRLHELVQADAALRAYKARPEALRELINCSFPNRLRCA
jgi:hypothetical protein